MSAEQTIDAVIAGVADLDYAPTFINDRASDVRDVLIPSATILMGELKIHPGGCVSNTGLAMARFGMNVRLIGKIGNDESGRILSDFYRKYTTLDSMIFSETEGTSYSIVVAPEGIDRFFLHFPGGNDTFGADDIDYELVKKARLFHFGYPPVMRRFRSNNGAELAEMFRRVHEAGVVSSLDTCGIDEGSEAGRLDWMAILRNTLPHVDLFVPSAEETSFIFKRSLDTPEALSETAKDAMEMGAAIVMIKCGSRGLYLAAADKERLEKIPGELKKTLLPWAGRSAFIPVFVPDRILSANGAGDTCIAAFLSAILKGWTFEKCADIAAAAGAACCEHYDIVETLPNLKELKERIENGWKRGAGIN
ncbi:MAG: carbohydrate kinase family protein [Lachnospiraceae bacterium]|nr:carbohydrate kinase family protein [Lachnospiraceae bacterium]